MIYRNLYIDQIKEFIDKPLIKVLTGIRRSGKSTILDLVRKELVNKGVTSENIIYINFESLKYAEITEAPMLYEHIKGLIKNKKRYYILLDEIQEVKNWEKAINSFQVDFNTDIYITGSNSHLLSSELATYLSGRYIQFTIFTLSFTEYLTFRTKYANDQPKNKYTAFEKYLRLGGFPTIHTAKYTDEQSYKIIYDIYTSIILRDIVQRHKIRDIELLERVVKFVFNNIGNKFSAKNVSDYFKSQNRKLDINTIYNYLNALESSYIIHRISRFNIKGKEILKTNEKYFIGDQSLLYALMGYKDHLISGVLENIIMLELKRRGFQVFVGKLDALEIDFIAQKSDKKIYVQVAYKMTEQSTMERAYKPLLKINDNYPKYIITMDQSFKETYKGIEHRHIADFLIMKDF